MKLVAFAICVFTLCITSSRTSASIIVDRFGPGDSYNPSGSRSTERFPGRVNDVGQMFTVGGNDLRLSQIDLQLRGGTADVILVIARDDIAGKDFGTNPRLQFAPDPNGIIETFRISSSDLVGTFQGKQMTVFSSLMPRLSAGENCWIYLTTPTDRQGSTAWLSSVVNDPVIIAERFNKPLWEVSNPSGGYAFRVHGYAVPEPSVLAIWIALVITAVGWLALKRGSTVYLTKRTS